MAESEENSSVEAEESGGETGSSRRTLLAALAASVGAPAAGITYRTGAHRPVFERAGLGGTPETEPDPPEPDENGDERTPEEEGGESGVPDHPAAFFSPRHQDSFADGALPPYSEFDWESSLVRTPSLPVKYYPGVVVSEDGIGLEFDAYFTRPVRLGLNVISPGLEGNRFALHPEDRYPVIENAYVDADEHNEFIGRLDGQQTFFVDLDATGAYDGPPDPEDFQRYTFDFELNEEYDLPTDVSTHFHVLIQDGLWRESDDVERADVPFRLLGNHTHLKLSYLVPDGGTATNWVGNLQYHPKTPRELYRRHNATFDSFAITSDGSTDHRAERDYEVTYEVIPTDDGFWATSITNEPEEMEEYREEGDDGTLHQIRSANRAHTRPKWQHLARQMWDAQTTLGITDILDRVNGVAQFAQVIQYAYGNIREYGRTTGWRKPAFHLYDRIANCSSKTAIFAAILRCDPFDIRVGYLGCELELGDHMVGGVDVEHLEASSRDLSKLDTINYPEDVDAAPGVPEGDYAFVELTDPSRDVGEYDPDRYELHGFYDTNFGENRRF